MKKNLSKAIILFAIALFSINLASAQEQTEKKITYNFINEYGTLISKNVGFTSVFVNGIKINNSDAIGIGVGYGINTISYQEVPLFLNYRHYFQRGRKVIPLINVAIGTAANFWDEDIRTLVPYYNPDGTVAGHNWEYYTLHKHGFGLYSTVASGFSVKAFSFTAGLFFRTFPREREFNGGVEVKVGYTF